MVNASIRMKTRKAIEAEAEQSRRPISQVIDEWLTEGAKGRASLDALLGGTTVAGTMKQMMEVARRVHDEIGDPMESSSAYHALSAAFDGLSDTIPTRSQRSIQMARTKFKTACAFFARKAEETDPGYLTLDISPIVEAANARDVSTPAVRRKVRAVLNGVLRLEWDGLEQAASDLLEALDEFENELTAFVTDALKWRLVGHEMLRQTVTKTEALPATDILAEIYQRLDACDGSGER